MSDKFPCYALLSNRFSNRHFIPPYISIISWTIKGQSSNFTPSECIVIPYRKLSKWIVVQSYSEMEFFSLKKNLIFLTEFCDLFIFEAPDTRKKKWFGILKRINATIFILQTMIASYTNRHNFALLLMNGILVIGFLMAMSFQMLFLYRKTTIFDIFSWCGSHNKLKKASEGDKMTCVEKLQEEFSKKNFNKAAWISKFLSEWLGSYLIFVYLIMGVFANILTSIIHGEYRTILIIYWPCHQKLNFWTFMIYTLQHSFTITYLSAQFLVFNVMFWSFLLHLVSHYKVLNGLIKIFGELASTDPNELDKELWKVIIDMIVEGTR